MEKITKLAPFSVVYMLVLGIFLGTTLLASAETPLEMYTAPIQSITASSVIEPALIDALNASDWNWLSRWESDGEREGAWIEYTFTRPVRVGVIMLVDEANQKGAVEEVTFTFSDGDPLSYLLPGSPAFISEQNGYPYNPIDVDPHKPTDMSAHHLRLAEPRMTTRIRATITDMAEGTTQAGLAELRFLEVPKDDVQPQASPDEVARAARMGYGLTTNAPTQTFQFDTPTYSLTISKDTGLPERMTDLLPTPVDFIGGTNSDPFIVYAHNLDRPLQPYNGMVPKNICEDTRPRYVCWHVPGGSATFATFREDNP